MIPSAKLRFMRHAYATAVGTAAGAVVGIVGWGGAQVIVPSMTYPGPLASYSQLSATGISLSSLSVSAVSSGYKFWKDELVDIPLAMVIGVPAVVSARIGSRFAKKMSGDALALFFNGFSIILIPVHFWIQQRASSGHRAMESYEYNDDAAAAAVVGKSCDEACGHEKKDVPCPPKLTTQEVTGNDNPNTYFWTSTPLTIQHVSYGLVSGTISALMGVGGLPLTMSYITEATRLPHHMVQGTALVAVIPSILVSTASRMNAIPVHTAGWVALGAMGGGYGGAKVALSLSEDCLRFLYMGSLVLFGGRSTVGAFRNIRRICCKNS